MNFAEWWNREGSCMQKDGCDSQMIAKAAFFVAFVEGAKWNQWNATGFTAFTSERDQMEVEARERTHMPANDGGKRSDD